VNQLGMQAVAIKGADLFGHPDSGHARADGSVGKSHFLFGSVRGVDNKWRKKNRRK
jgi:hypothetical protein